MRLNRYRLDCLTMLHHKTKPARLRLHNNANQELKGVSNLHYSY